jgi:Ca-activated chloride channel homolog
VSKLARVICLACLVAGAVLLTAFGPSRRPELWFTPEQSADRLFRQEKYDLAAKTSGDPQRRGAAYYRAGDFKQATTAFARVSSAEGAYDRANALVMRGKYADAVKSYDRALLLRPGWKEAEENRAVAVVRRDRMNFKGGDSGDNEKADDVVFEKGKKAGGDEVQVAGGEPLSDEQLRAMWLRRVQTKPADFLRAKFAFQLQQSEGGAK